MKKGCSYENYNSWRPNSCIRQEIVRRESVKFGANLEHILNLTEFKIISTQTLRTTKLLPSITNRLFLKINRIQPKLNSQQSRQYRHLKQFLGIALDLPINTIPIYHSNP